MNRLTRRALAKAAVAAALLAPAFAAAETAEEFYTGKDITFIVSAPAGTLTDFVARQFATHFTTHMAGHPTVVVMNRAGAGGMLAATQLQHRDEKDGTVIGFLQRNNLYRGLLDQDDSFDPRGVTWLGSLEKIAYAVVARTDAGVTTAEELFEKPLILGATGFSNENRTLPAIANDYLGTHFELVYGYSGRGEVYLAIERNEVAGWASTIAGLTQGEVAEMLTDGRMKVLLHLSRERHPAYPDVPSLADFDAPPEVGPVLDFITLPFDAGRPVAVPAGVPADRVAALRDAFAATAADPAFLAAMKDADYPVEAITGQDIEAILAMLYATPEPVLETVRSYVKAEN